ncbi:sortase [Actinocorallia longicatena]|uniref:Sortase n=1 Tax=Actinocorallia longicatena TaxID=111803 RepID=A0ABP6PZM4_9ACTN
MTAVEVRPAAEAAEETPPTPPEGRGSAVLRMTGVSVSLLGVLLLGFVGYLALLSPLQHDRDQVTLYADFRYALAQGTAPVGADIDPGTAVAVLTVPRLGLREVVVEGTSSAELAHGPGHRRDTPLPGQPGVSVLLGRAGTYGGPFGGIGRLHSGDVITVATGQGLASYVVNGLGPQIMTPPAGSSTLVLVTADNRVAPTGEVLVTASLTSQPVPGNSAKRPVIGASEVGLTSDTAAVVPLMLWAEALLLAVALTTWSYLRWSRWPTYVTSTPVLLAILWNIFECVARLLPNTL